jgi:hypothetical protein
MAMEDKVMGIGELRADLGGRVEAAFHHGEPTIVEHGKRKERRAALVPYVWLEELYRLRAQQAPSDDAATA